LKRLGKKGLEFTEKLKGLLEAIYERRAGI